MPTTTGFRFGDIVLVPFPFTDQTGLKKRPAVVVSSDAYHRKRIDVVVMALSSQVLRPPDAVGEVLIAKWQEAGLAQAIGNQARLRHDRARSDPEESRRASGAGPAGTSERAAADSRLSPFAA